MGQSKEGSLRLKVVEARGQGQSYNLKFQAQNLAWLAFGQPGGDLVNTIPDQRFSRDNLFNLTVCQ